MCQVEMLPFKVSIRTVETSALYLTRATKLRPTGAWTVLLHRMHEWLFSSFYEF
jgi:hypothetical protein